ncbi:MAG: four-helix bundle copper-binding protein [Burkholderiaceae bacterium]
METSHAEQVDDALARCIAACNDCNKICLQNIEHCLSLGGPHAEPAHMSMMLTCAAVCRTASELMSLNSEWHPTMCDLCAQVCDECADECEELGEMEDCVTACQDCADACREMVGEQADDEEEDEDEKEPQGDELVTNERMN